MRQPTKLKARMPIIQKTIKSMPPLGYGPLFRLLEETNWMMMGEGIPRDIEEKGAKIRAMDLAYISGELLPVSSNVI